MSNENENFDNTENQNEEITQENMELGKDDGQDDRQDDGHGSSNDSESSDTGDNSEDQESNESAEGDKDQAKDKSLDKPETEEDKIKKEKWVQRRLAQQDRVHKRQMRELQQQLAQQKSQAESLFSPEQLEAYKNQEQMQQMQQMQLAQMAKDNKFKESVEATRDKYEDFEESVLNPEVDKNFSEAMILAAKNCPEPGELIYHLSKNPKEVKRISRLPVDQQVRAMYLAEAEMKNLSKAMKPSAPPPIAQTRAAPKSTSGDTSNMSFAEVLEMRRREMMARFPDRK